MLFLALINVSNREDLSYAIMKGLDYCSNDTRDILVSFHDVDEQGHASDGGAVHARSAPPGG